MSNQKSRESFLLHVMNNGFLRAANSFSKFIGKNTKVTHVQPANIRRNDLTTVDGKGNLYVLTTQIIGELVGKSYLIFNEEECRNLTMLVGHTSSTPTTEQMNEAVLIEIDNIISASVIAEISEALQIEIYGDVPVLKKIPAQSLNDFVTKDGNHSDANNIISIETIFQFSVDKQILPRFTWKISEKVLDLIPTERLTVK